jgi:adhesin/invasin
MDGRPPPSVYSLAMKYSCARTLLAAAAALLGALSCSKATPVAPSGAVLSISANPSQIGLNGASTITIFGSKPNGSPLDPGTQIRLSTTLGTIEGITTVQSGGTATATLRGDGRSGSAMVTAATGAGTAATAMTSVQIGIATGQKPVLLVSADPSNVPVQGSSLITIIARNSDGSPVSAGQQVLLTTTLGTLSPSRPLTKADGTATATLNAGTQAGTATVSAVLGASDAATAMVTIRDAAVAISLQASPSTVPASGGTITLTAFVTNSQGQPLQGAAVTFSSARGTLATTGVVFTDTTGVATNTLTLTQAQLTGVTSFQATARTPSGSGTILESAVTITVQ